MLSPLARSDENASRSNRPACHGTSFEIAEIDIIREEIERNRGVDGLGDVPHASPRARRSEPYLQRRRLTVVYTSQMAGVGSVQLFTAWPGIVILTAAVLEPSFHFPPASLVTYHSTVTSSRP